MPNSNDFNHFTSNPTDIQIDRSMFNLDHSVKFSCNVGDCIPFEVIEVLPGDTFEIETSKVIRLQPLVKPIFDEVIQDVYYFFCPSRLVWDHWKRFCGENDQGPWANQYHYNIPTIEPPVGGWDVGSIADYMGIPPKVKGESVNALPFRAYALICDQWFRSEAVMNPVNVSTGDSHPQGSNGNNQVTDIQLGGAPFVACKFFDYFTSGLPSPQRGDAANLFASMTFAPVASLKGSYISNHGLLNPHREGAYHNGSIYDTPKFTAFDPHSTSVYGPTTNTRYLINRANDATYPGLTAGTDTAVPGDYNYYLSNLFANLGSSNMTINDLRSAFAVQRYLEKSARFGGRYITFIKGFFGVDSPDARLQRTEYIGGSRLSLNINSVEQTSATSLDSTPQGNLAGMSVTADINHDAVFSSTEHGYIIGISVLRYHHSYQQALNKMWMRRSFTDFYLPTFAFLGEAPIYNNEICYNSEHGRDVFAYQERWAEYRYLPNRIAGEFRSVSVTPLDMWHLGDYYASVPTLSPEWLREDKTMLDRCLAITSEVANQCLCDFYIKIKAARPLPMYSIPGMIDHY